MEINRTVDESIKKPSIWKNWNFIGIWTGSMLTNLTMNFYTIALPLIIYELTRSTLAMSSMRAIEILPNLFLGIIIGVFVDRIDRKTFMRLVILMKLLIVFLIISLLYSSQLMLWHLYPLGFLFYTSIYAFSNAYHSSIPLIVRKDQLVTANSIRSLTNTLITIIAPAIAGFIIFNYGHITIFSITIICYFILLALVSAIHIPSIKNNLEKRNGIIQEVKNGWKKLKEIKLLWNLTITLLLVNIASTAAGGVLVFFSLEHLSLTEKDIGIVLSSQAIGGLIASLFAKKIFDKLNIKSLFTTVILLIAVAQLVLFSSKNLYHLCFAVFLIGMNATLFNIKFVSIRQELTPPEFLGRVTGFINTMTTLAAPLSFLTAGIVGEVVDVRYIFLISSVLMFTLFLRLLNTKFDYSL